MGEEGREGAEKRRRKGMEDRGIRRRMENKGMEEEEEQKC